MILDTIAKSTRKRVDERKYAKPLKQVMREALLCAERDRDGGHLFEKALSGPGVSFICEVKKASPSKGLITPEFPYVDIARECFKRNLKMFSARRFISGCSDRKPNILNTV